MLLSCLSCLMILTYTFAFNSKTDTTVRTVSVGERFVVKKLIYPSIKYTTFQSFLGYKDTMGECQF